MAVCLCRASDQARVFPKLPASADSLNLFSILPLSKDVNIKQKISCLPQGHSFLSEFIPGTGEKIRKLHLGEKTSLWPFIPLWKNYYQYFSSMIFVFSQLQQLLVKILKCVRFGDFYVFECFGFFLALWAALIFLFPPFISHVSSYVNPLVSGSL